MEQAANPRPEQSAPRSSASLWSRHGYKLLALLPFAFVVSVVAKSAIDVPLWDQWSLVPLLEKVYAGKLTFSDLWAQHNEHRILFPQLIMVGLARLTGWNTLVELGVNVALALGLFVILVSQIRATERRLAVAGLRWAIPVTSLITFSVSQYQNWLWGWQIQMLLNLLAAVGGILLLSNPVFLWRRFTAAALLGIVATYSFANGVLSWPIGLGILLLGTRGRQERKPAIAVWMLVGLLSVGLYLWRYQQPAGHPAPTLVFDMPLTYANYVLKYLGGIGAQFFSGPLPGQQAEGSLALFLGLLGALGLGWAGSMLLWQKRARSRGATTLLRHDRLFDRHRHDHRRRQGRIRIRRGARIPLLHHGGTVLGIIGCFPPAPDASKQPRGHGQFHRQASPRSKRLLPNVRCGLTAGRHDCFAGSEFPLGD